MLLSAPPASCYYCNLSRLSNWPKRRCTVHINMQLKTYTNMYTHMYIYICIQLDYMIYIYIYVYIVSLCIQCVIVLYYIKLHHIIVVDLIQHVLYYVVPVNIISYWFILYVYIYIYNIILYHSRLYHVTYHIPYHRLYYVCTFLKAPAIGGKILLHIKSPNVIFSPEVCKCRWRLLCHGSFLNYLVEFSELRHLL